jgi:apolipoprotein N-acyltransferase
MVNLTNDAWFGDSTEPAQHLAMAVYVAVEQRGSLVRAVNPGGSAFIDPLGRILARTALLDPARTRTPTDGAVASLPLVEGGKTLYDRMGDTFAELCVILSLAMVAWAYAPTRLPHSRAHRP